MNWATSVYKSRRSISGAKTVWQVSFPPHLLDELARVFARVALEHLLEESVARGPRQEPADTEHQQTARSVATKENPDGSIS